MSCVAALFLFAFSVRWTDVWDQLRGVGPMGLVILFPPAAIFCSQVVGWAAILRRLGHGVSLARLALISLGNQAQRMALPGGVAVAEPMQIWALDRWSDVGVESAVTSVTTKRVLTWLTNGIVSGAALVVVIAAGEGATGLAKSHPAVWALAVATVGLLATSALVVASMRTERLLVVVRRGLALLPSQRLRAWLDATSRGWEETARRMARAVGSPLALAWPSLWFLASWLIDVAETWLLLWVLGRPLPWVECLVIEVLAGLLKSLAFASPGGLGAQDVGYAMMLSAYGVPGAAELAMSFVILKRGKEAVWTVIGLAAVTTWPLSRRPT